MQHLSRIMSLGLMVILLLVPAATFPPSEPSLMTCGRCRELAEEAGEPDPKVPLKYHTIRDTQTCNGLRPARDGCNQAILVQMFRCPECQILAWKSITFCRHHGYPDLYYTVKWVGNDPAPGSTSNA
ncbi:hypothetical protein PGT21_027594 [Puccinia graminis f. sp. tritici]|uniref:Uncharacterized protein n=1 Tax=Puccinia graminis f. sp. tritici TaxID=56615 RepID=A0A5B0PFS7_PUCGR|nr:hypothetical protein PGT21_025677 [Puccinia graminis f. sp. tritici]KAA1112244.1 hypothetical protein PGTUg99_010534 [Puccinia graminis f. sp. tritici]KAA1117936.1 hypothetical protein PGT21_027594 [Puccinia graminis f. sp. tritici]KAA1123444.1 hypothetical protein PGTUg99_010806 [Puccinia graminis f. sp. tritici]